VRIAVEKSENGLWRVKAIGGRREGNQIVTLRDVARKDIRLAALDLIYGMRPDERPK